MDYAGNSNKNKEKDQPEKEKIEKVVTEEVTVRQKPIGRKMKEIFFGGEFKSAARYVGADVLLPALRNLIVDASTRGIERMVYGDSSYSRPRRAEYRPRVTYNNPINRGYVIDTTGRANLPDQPSRSRNRLDGVEFVLTTRGEAETVVERLGDILDRYEVASLADLKELLGLKIDHVDNKWGWFALNGIDVRQIREGYLLDLPPMETI